MNELRRSICTAARDVVITPNDYAMTITFEDDPKEDEIAW
jgi:hypothetical protein